MNKKLQTQTISYIQFEPEELESLGWEEGQKLNITEEEDGSIVLSPCKKVELNFENYSREDLKSIIEICCERDISPNELFGEDWTHKIVVGCFGGEYRVVEDKRDSSGEIVIYPINGASKRYLHNFKSNFKLKENQDDWTGRWVKHKGLGIKKYFVIEDNGNELAFENFEDFFCPKKSYELV